MTNAEKYLKVSTKEFINAINTQGDIGGLYSLEKWLDTEAKPTLTEDERVILRNVGKEWKAIYRDIDGELELHTKVCEAHEDCGWTALYGFSHLFKFIKNNEQYSIEELLKGE